MHVHAVRRVHAVTPKLDGGAIYIHLLSLGIWPQEAITKYCAHLHHTLAALKRYFPASLVAPLPNSEQIKHTSSNHTYTKSTPIHIHRHGVPYVTPTHPRHTSSLQLHPCGKIGPPPPNKDQESERSEKSMLKIQM